MLAECILNLRFDVRGHQLVCWFVAAAELQEFGAQPVLTASEPSVDWAATVGSGVAPQDTLVCLLANSEVVRA